MAEAAISLHDADKGNKRGAEAFDWADPLDLEGLVDQLLVLVDDGAHAHPAGEPLALADDRPLLDQGDGRGRAVVVVEAMD